MDKLFWLIPGKLAGRAGPDVEPWDLNGIKSAGITAIVSTHEECHAQSVAKSGLKHICKFMPTAYPTNDALVDRFVDLVRDATDAVLAEIRSGGAVVVHCYAGRDRTGLVLCAALMQLEKVDAKTALARVRAVRPTALTGPGVVEVLKQYERVYHS